MKTKLTQLQDLELKRYLLVRDKESAIDDWFDVDCELSTYIELKKLSASDFTRAIIDGYEVEETPEEKILESYRNAVELLDTKFNNLPEGYMQGTKDCTEFILDTLGIKIKGINE